MAVVAAVALILAGVRLLGAGLADLAATRARAWLQAWSAVPERAFLAGLLATAALQSSSATTLLVVSLAAGGWLDGRGAVAAVVGANVGTTVSSQLLALPSGAAAPPLLALAALALWLATAPRGPGLAALGLALLFDGLARLDRLAGAAAGTPAVQAWLDRALAGQAAAFASGWLVTTAIDSSSAAIGLAQRLAEAGLLSPAPAFAFVCGADVGTTSATLAAALPLGPAARRAAAAHLAFNLFSAALFWPLAPALAGWAWAAAGGPARALAHLHLLINVVPAALIWPWQGRLAAALARWVP